MGLSQVRSPLTFLEGPNTRFGVNPGPKPVRIAGLQDLGLPGSVIRVAGFRGSCWTLAWRPRIGAGQQALHSSTTHCLTGTRRRPVTNRSRGAVFAFKV